MWENPEVTLIRPFQTEVIQSLIADVEVVVRTTHLLAKMEQTTAEDYNASHKAIIFGSFG